MQGLISDIRYTLRGIRRSPGFALIVVLTLALGVGANVMIFTLINGVLLRPPPGVSRPDRLVAIYTSDYSGPPYSASSWLDYQDFRSQSATLSDIASYAPRPMAVSTGSENFRGFGELVSGNYFRLLGVHPVVGRVFSAGEGEQPGADPVVVISYSMWQNRYGGAPDVAGRTLRIAGHPFTIIGVAPRGFSSLLRGIGVDLWVPQTMGAVVQPGSDVLERRSSRGLLLVGRLKPHATFPQAQADLSLVAHRLHDAHPDSWTDVRKQSRIVSLVPQIKAGVFPRMRGAVVGFFAVLMVVAGLVLVICCANLANLLLARGTGRQKEVAIRLALGANRRRLVRQLVTESMALALLGGGVGVLIATQAARLVQRLQPPLPIPVSLNLAPDLRVLVFAAAAATLTGLVFGLYPALRATRPQLTSMLHESAPLLRIIGRRLALRDVLVVGQVAVSTVLLIAAGLFLRSLQKAQSLDIGFQPDHLALATFELGIQGYTDERGRIFYDQLLEQARRTPGVESASLVRDLPLSVSFSRRGLQRIEGYEPGPTEDIETGYNVVDTAYFRTMGVHLVRGRAFSSQDRTGATPVVIVNQAFAQRYWPDQDPLGRHITFADAPAEVVGVAQTGKYASLSEEDRPYFYIPWRQEYQGDMTLLLRTAGPPGESFTAIQREAAAIDRDLPVQLTTMDDHLGFATLAQRIGAALLGAFGAVGILLAGIGLYGVMAYVVSRRTREMGIRMALGSERSAVMGLVLRQAFRLTAIGLVIGMGIAAAICHLLGRFLLGVPPLDPLTFGAVVPVFALAALAASLAPARRATRVAPVEALRAE